MSQQTATDDKAMLLAYLNVQRNHIRGILEGLSEEDLRRPVLPSGWSCIGMVQHLALDDERFWFRAVMTGEQTVIDEMAGIGNAWHVASDVPVADIFETYRQEIDRADAIINATPLDAKPAWWPDFFGDFRLDDMRDVMLHVIAETACHAGHLDVVRELIDGRTWMILTD